MEQIDQRMLRRLVAESDIRQVVYRYCRGIDRMEPALVRSCYHDDATDSHGTWTGTADEFVEWSSRLSARYSSTTHFIGNLLIELEPELDVAHVESYAIAFHRRPEGPPHDNLAIGCRYIDRFEHRVVGEGHEPEWRIARRVVVTDWLQLVREDDWFPIDPKVLQGRRGDHEDPVFTSIPRR